MKILLVEDELRLADVVKEGLVAEGFSVDIVSDGVTGLWAATANPYDVIVLDISMPGMTGFEVAAALRAQGSQSAVVFLTVHEEDDFFSVARSAGGLGYVIKPRLLTDLVEAVLAVNQGRSFTSPKL